MPLAPERLLAEGSVLKTVATVLLLLAGSLTPFAAQGRVIHVEISNRSDVLDGKPFGIAGPYERLSGRVTFAVKPGAIHNRQIVDLGLAPLDSNGDVEFSADFLVLRPKDLARGNGAALFEVPNRGRILILSLFDGGGNSSDPSADSDFGDGFLLNNGYTLAWVGCQADLAGVPQRMRLDSPVARAADGSPLTGLVRADFTPWRRVHDWPLGHLITGLMGGAGYAVASPRSLSDVLTVRDTPHGERTLIPNSTWQFARTQGAQLVPDATYIHLAGGFEKGRIYEVVYQAQNPRIAGLGFAAVRDFLSYLKYDPEALAPARRVYAIGISQSGRFLRHFLFQDFNADENGRKVIDGLIAHTGGAGRGSFNHRFAQPSRDAEPMSSIDYPTDLFPFTDLPETDPSTGERRGLLDLATASHTVPRIFFTNTSFEYWGSAASLIHTAPDGKSDAQLSPSVRIFFLAGLDHISGPSLPPEFAQGEMRGQEPVNPNPVGWLFRALLTDMDQWVSKDVSPPDSRYPHLEDGTLVARAMLQFPKIPGVALPSDPQQVLHIDFGPEWKDGVITREPPKPGLAFSVLVPRVDKDGNDLGGVTIPELAVPLATYTGWNLRDASIGAPTQRVSFLGSYIPFPRSAEERKRIGDPRTSIAERYHGKEEYMSLYAAAVKQAIQQRFALAGDMPAMVNRGAVEWQVALGQRPIKPEPLPEEVAMPVEALREYVGNYPVRPSLVLTVTEEGGILFVQTPGRPRDPILPSGKDDFFFTAFDAQIRFQRDRSGAVIGLLLHQENEDLPAKRTAS